MLQVAAVIKAAAKVLSFTDVVQERKNCMIVQSDSLKE